MQCLQTTTRTAKADETQIFFEEHVSESFKEEIPATYAVGEAAGDRPCPDVFDEGSGNVYSK